MIRRHRILRALVMCAAFASSAPLLTACGGGDATKPVDNGARPETVVRVEVTAPATTLSPQQTVPFSAVARNAAGTTIGSVTPVWSSSAIGVATVNASGIVTGIAPGTAIISANAGAVSGSVTVTVTNGAGVLASLAIDLQDRTIELGQATQASVVGRDGQGTPVALGNRVVTWTTSNPSVATVSSSGVVSGVGVGLVDVRVSVADGAAPRTGSVPLMVQGIAGAPFTSDVIMTPDRFVPYQTSIRQNGTVRFIFPTLVHNVIWDRRLAGAPADINNTSEATITRTFPTVGVFFYRCTLHPGMDGEIIVSP